MDAATLALAIPIVACVLVFAITIGKSGLQTLRVTFGALAILAAFTLVNVLGAARQDAEVLVPAAMGFARFLAIPAFLALLSQSPSRKAIAFAFGVAAISLASDILSVAGVIFFGAFLAESGRRAGVGDVFPAFFTVAAYMAMAFRALLAGRAALRDRDAATA